MTDVIKYLENFWIPQPGNSVKYKGEVSQIKFFEEDYPEQIVLSGRDEITFIQDCEWAPTFGDLDQILQRLGITVCDDCLQVGRSGLRPIFFKKPESFEDYAKVIRDTRYLSYQKGEELLDDYFDERH